jgi:hypothetical protein
MTTTNPEAEVDVSVADRLAAHYAEEEPEAQEATPEPEAQEEQVEEAAEEAVEEESEFIEFEGQRFTPEELRASILRQKDYTQKTQEVAERRRSLEERERALEHMEQAREATFDAAVKLRNIEAQLQQFQALDWDQLFRTDQAEALRLDRAQRQLQQEYMEQRNVVAAGVQQVTSASEQGYQQAVNKTREAVSQEAWWSQQVDEQIGKFADAVGLTQYERRAVASNPNAYRLLHDAMKWRELQASKPALTKRVVDAKTVKVASRTTQDAQTNAAYAQARDRLRKTGKGAEEALAAIYERTRKR